MPIVVPSPEVLGLVARAQSVLRLSQSELGELVGASRRTITRWYAGDSSPGLSELQTIARAVHPLDAGLAAAIVAETGETLVGLAIERAPPPVAPAPPPPPPPAPAPTPAPRPFPPERLVVDSIVCAAAESMQCAPGAVRQVLHAAFSRARALGLTLEEVDDALAPADAPAAEKPAKPAQTARSKSATRTP